MILHIDHCFGSQERAVAAVKWLVATIGPDVKVMPYHHIRMISFLESVEFHMSAEFKHRIVTEFEIEPEDALMFKLKFL